MFQRLRQNNYRILIIISVLLLSIWGMYLRYERRGSPLWCDERTQVSQMDSLRIAIRHSSLLSQLPGEHLLIYPFYKLFGEHKWGLGIPKIIIAIIGFYLLYLLCRKYFKTPWGYIITFAIFASNYTLARHAFEIRPYGVLAVLNIANFLVMQYICETPRPPLLKRILVSIFIFVSILYHSFGAYILFFCYVFHLLFSRKGASIGAVLWRQLKYYGPGLVVTLPLWYHFMANNADAGRFRLDTFEYCGRGVSSMLRAVFGNLTGRRMFYVLLPGIIINFFLPHKQRLKQIMFFLILTVLPIGILFLICFYRHYWFIQRMYTWAIPLFAFLIGWSWESIIIYFREKVIGKIIANPIFALGVAFLALMAALALFAAVSDRSLVYGAISGGLSVIVGILIYLKLYKGKWNCQGEKNI